jgi:Flp pilus assembly pilin Flp
MRRRGGRRAPQLLSSVPEFDAVADKYGRKWRIGFDMSAFVQLLRDDGGATMAEYAIVVSLVAVVCVVVISIIGQEVSSLFFQQLANQL